MAEKATTDKTAADTVAIPDTTGTGVEVTTTSAAKAEPVPVAAKAESVSVAAKGTTGRTSARRTSKGDKEGPEPRFEEYISHKPDGNGGYTEVTVRRNIDTGASVIVDG